MAKAPWQMTRAEWDQEFRETRPNAQGTGGDSRLGGMGRATTERGLGARFRAAMERQDFLKMGLPDARHRTVVEEAIRRGYPVPRRVLREYPDLAPASPQSGGHE